MIRFGQKVFDSYIKGTQPVYTDIALADLLGSVDSLAVAATAYQVSGGSPTLTIQFEQSPDRARWLNRNATPEINNSSISSETGVNGFDRARIVDAPRTAYVRLRIQLGGTGPAAVIRVWATGCDPDG